MPCNNKELIKVTKNLHFNKLNDQHFHPIEEFKENIFSTLEVTFKLDIIEVFISKTVFLIKYFHLHNNDLFL